MDFFQACLCCSSPVSSVSLQSLLFIFGINGHCSAVENNQARKPGFVPSNQVLFLSCLGVGGGGMEMNPSSSVFKWLFQHLWWFFCLMDADSCCWRRKASYQCFSGLQWGRDKANHAGSCLCPEAQKSAAALYTCHTTKDGYFQPLGKTQKCNFWSEGEKLQLRGRVMFSKKQTKPNTFFFLSLYPIC